MRYYATIFTDRQTDRQTEATLSYCYAVAPNYYKHIKGDCSYLAGKQPLFIFPRDATDSSRIQRIY